MHESFGARMRHHRERRGVSIATIAHQTKLKASLLEALERDDISQWPSGIFRRAYVRSYAQAIGLDADLIARQFLEIHPEPEEALELPPEPPARLRSLVDSALGSLSLRRRAPRVERRPEPPAEEVSSREPAAESTSPPLREPAPAAAAPGSPLPAASPLLQQPAERAKPVVDTRTPAGPVAAPTRAAAPTVPRIKSNVDLMAAARLCTELGRIGDSSAIPPLLREAARILDARGVIVWLWDSATEELRPAAAHGYSEKLLRQLAGVKRTADNPTAEAFRTGRPCSMTGTADASAALVVPLMTADGAAGALALELPVGREQMTSVRAVATFLAAMLAQLTGGMSPSIGEDQSSDTTTAVRRESGRRAD